MGNVNFGSGISAPGGSPWVQVLAQSNVAVVAPSDTAENTLFTYTLPGGLMGPNDAVEMECLVTCTNNANVKTLKMTFGGTTYHSASLASATFSSPKKKVFNANSVSSQVGIVAAGAAYNTTTTGTPITSSVNTGADVVIAITMTKATGSDTVTLLSCSIRLIRAPI